MAKASLENISSLSCIRETTGQRSLEAILQYEKQFSIHSVEELSNEHTLWLEMF